jgi:cobalt-zinc-cadmium efflux system outer membrane protein
MQFRSRKSVAVAAFGFLAIRAVSAWAVDPGNRASVPFAPPRVQDELPIPGIPSPAALSLSELQQLALRNNPTLAASHAQIDSARGREIQAGLYPNPSFGYLATDIGEDHTAGEQGGFVSQEFVTGGKLKLDRAVAAQDVQERISLADAQQLRVLTDVRLRFYDALAAQKRVELSDELVKVAGQSADLSQRLLQAQQASQNDLLQAQIETSEAEIVATNARNERTQAWRRLTAVVGNPNLTLQSLAGEIDQDIPNYEWEQTYTALMVGSPELSAAMSRVQRARLSITRAHCQNIPNINVMVNAGYRNQTKDDVAGVQAGIPLPVFNRNQGNIFQAESDLVAADNDVRRIQLDLQNRLAIAFRRYENARQQVQRYQNEILPRAKQSIELVTQSYSAGQLDFQPLLTSQRTYVRTNLMYLDALVELRQASTLIEGQLLSESLQSGGSATQPGM